MIRDGAELWEWLGEEEMCADIGFDRFIGLLILALH